MKIHTIKMQQQFDAPVEQVWDAFNDHATFGKIMGQKMERIVDSPDKDNVNGLGSIRLIKAPGLSFQETIKRSEKPVCIEYQISGGVPVGHHYGKMQFSSIGDGKSAIDYSIELGLKVPLVGGLISAALKKGIQSGLANYARRLQKQKAV